MMKSIHHFDSGNTDSENHLFGHSVLEFIKFEHVQGLSDTDSRTFQASKIWKKSRTFKDPQEPCACYVQITWLLTLLLAVWGRHVSEDGTHRWQFRWQWFWRRYRCQSLASTSAQWWWVWWCHCVEEPSAPVVAARLQHRPQHSSNAYPILLFV